MTKNRLAYVLSLCAFLFLPSTGSAQNSTTGAIAGAVRDTSGAAMPGVTVEVTSPALIDKVRTTVTDAEGLYKIVDLRPGTYTAIFTLTGFSTFKREGIELTTGFTATVNVDMKIGSLEETILVSGASPVVDTRNVNQQSVLSRDAQDALPTGRTYAAFAALTLGAKGATADVGGNKGESTPSIQIHDSRVNDGKLMIDGMNFNHTDGAVGGGLRAYFTNAMAMQEVALTTGSSGAEWETSGVNVNFIPKDGGNTFRMDALVNFANGSLQSSNLDDALRARRATTAPATDQIHDAGIGVGGPIVTNRLWFYTSARHWHASEFQPGAYWNLNQGSLFYTPDLSRRGATESGGWDVSQRLTWQATPKNKFAFYGSRQNVLSYVGISAASAPDAGTYSDYRPQWITQGTWTAPVTNRFLLEAGATYIANYLNILPEDQFARSNLGVITPSTLQIVDTGLGITYGNSTNWRRKHAPNANARFSVSYITGSHAFKTGVAVTHLYSDINIFAPDLTYTFKNKVPTGLTEFALPRPDALRANAVALYTQDAWTLRKLTINLGARFDYLNGYTDPVQLPGSRFLPAGRLSASTGVPTFKDIDPRFGIAYDLFGNGKTAVKAAIGRYIIGHGVDIAIASDPSGAITASTTRPWNDSTFGPGDPRTGNFIPDCDLTNPAANGECGAVSNGKFGTLNPTLSYADDASRGWGVRDYNWEAQVSIQHELRPGLSVNAGYYRVWYGNLTATKNTLTTPADYSSYCVTTPSDSRLPGAGNQRLCGLYDVSPTLNGKINNVVTAASRYGGYSEVFNGVDISVNSRFGRGGQVNGGVSIGQTVTDTCAVVESPQEARPGFCHVTLPWWQGQGQLKFNFIYPLPWWSLQTSATYQNLAGAPTGLSTLNGLPVQGTWTVLNALIQPSLGRPLAAGVNGTATIAVIPTYTQFEDRLSQLDLRFTKSIKAGRSRLDGSIDIYNVFNANTVLASNPVVGTNYLVPTAILGPRLFKFQLQMRF